MSTRSSGTLQEDLTAGASPVTPVRPHLYVALECDRPTAGSARYDLGQIDEIVVGRGEARGSERGERRLKLAFAAPRMSAVHARIARGGDGWVLEDLGSTNGTHVNGHRVARVRVRDGDVIEIGRVLFVLREAVPTPDGTPADADTESARGDDAVLGMTTLIPPLAAQLDALSRITRSLIPVLLLGETGTGKEVLARAVHMLSGRTGRFVPVNCGALAPNLVEGQLFGHRRGAYSGAVGEEAGFVRASHGGTLFLDEIGDLPLPAQALLLRVIQENEVVPLGSSSAIPVDLRIIAATHQPLVTFVDRGLFRSDLYARLDGFAHALMPLRDRREELGVFVASLIAHGAFGAKIKTIAADAGRGLVRYEWPRNVRELGLGLARAAVLADDGALELSHLPAVIAEGAVTRRAPAPSELGAPAAPEEDSAIAADLRRRLEPLLVEHAGNVADVARAMGKARMQVHRWMKKLRIDPNAYRPK